MAAADPGLGSVYSQIEEARHLARVGRYPESKRKFEGVLSYIRQALKPLEDPVLKARWQECARALEEELQLVDACEDECAALRVVPTAEKVCAGLKEVQYFNANHSSLGPKLCTEGLGE